MVVPPLAGVVNCGIWLAYGLAVKDKNISMVVVNSTGVAFNLVYTIVFILNPKSGTRHLYKLGAVLVAVALAAAIVAMDRNLFISKWGWDLPSAIGMSGAITGSFMYSFGAMVSMIAAWENRGAGGFSAYARASFANAVVWLSYAWVQKDMSMKIANSMGIFCFVLQTCQLAFFHFKKAREEEAEGIRQNLLDAQA